MLKPSAFIVRPWNCIFQKSEYETIARNCMIILKRLGDEWQTLTEEQYVQECMKDGRSEPSVRGELSYFREVAPYTTSAEQAAKFSSDWMQILNPPKTKR